MVHIFGELEDTEWCNLKQGKIITVIVCSQEPMPAARHPVPKALQSVKTASPAGEPRVQNMSLLQLDTAYCHPNYLNL